MKKWLIGIVTAFLLFLIGSYFFIPQKIVLKKTITANANQSGVYRFLTDLSNWPRWWPGSSSTFDGADTLFESGGYRFKKATEGYNTFKIVIEKGKTADSSQLHIFPLGSDSTTIEWGATINTGSNPFSRISRYFKAKELSKSLEAILTSLQTYTGNVKNIYGIEIKKEKVKIEFLVSMSKSFTQYPSTADTYEMISKIKKYISQEQAKEEDHPMLHINVYDSTHFEAQVGIPVNKMLPGTAIFSSKRMLKNGNILVAEILGGKTNADYGMKQLELYVSDHQYYSVALPFYSLVTNRMNMADTGKWITRIYYPIL